MSQHSNLPPLKSSLRAPLVLYPVFFIGALGIVLSTAGAGRPQTKADQRQVLKHEVVVAVKLVQVFVTGKDGKPVADLTAEDFEISDNGRVVPVEHLERHFPNVSEEILKTALPTPRMNRKFILFFDFAFCSEKGALKAKKAGLHFLASELRPSDEVALLSYSAARGLTLHEFLTTDHQKIRRIVDGFGLKDIAGRAERLTEFMFKADPDLSREDEEDKVLFSWFDARPNSRVGEIHRLAYTDQTRRFFLVLNNLAKALRSVPGYKNIVLFSAGIARQILYGRKGGVSVGEWQTPEQLAQELADYDEAQADSGLRNDLSQALKEFKASNCPVYAVDVSRVQEDVDIAAPGGTAAAAGEIAGADSLRQVASDTGGKYYASTVDVKVSMDDIKNVTGAYYILGYTIDEQWDGKFHKIKVKVKRKDCEVQTQGGYFNPKPFSKYSSFERLLHMIDLALNENPQFQIPHEVGLVALPVLVKGWSQVAAFTRIPEDLAEDVVGKKSEALFLVFDGKGNMVTLKNYRLKIPEDAKGSLIPSFLVSIQPGRYSFRMVIRNMETGRGARGFTTLIVPEAPPASVRLDPPLLLTADRNAHDIGSSSQATLSSLYAYDRDSYAPLSGGIPAGTGKLYAALRCSGGSGTSEMEFSVSLSEEGSQVKTDVPFTAIGRSVDGDTQFCLLELTPAVPKPGRYQLHISVQKTGSGESASTASVVTFK